ncbi:MAG: 4-(cytidine 5'-diphospho)-2-C-methyl-D-erythritol kinase [Colwellia sp.]|nr:4-(cytidine 5'-diphospho)-2-C-methyl-D-erythritol kinase [Colwellia sp.]MCW8865182.1 4-(cytidine 5'-diphospho)-2-C-methyl-D-erythritol kinase [Colwellia sp.]MCW9082825.1 4-(cytidine 5'-diphospho)-2-C-methyl-D-erythritol kinase [Colwellia sp.]
MTSPTTLSAKKKPPYINIPFSFPSPAKLNLFLHVVGQRSDGYHELETLFQFLNYSDNLEISVTEHADIKLLTPIEGVEHKDNLIVKAALLLQKKWLQKKPEQTKLLGAKISIDKVLPMGGGLGGGSSNAATVLVALNTLWHCNFTNNELAEMGLSLGADVPIFVHGFSAFAQGVGEQLTPVAPCESWYLVTKPDVSISTASVFTSKDLPRDTEKIISNNFSADYQDSDLFPISPLKTAKYHNDCQTMVIKHYDQVANLLAWLIEYAPSRMTGTGACIFSRFSSQQEACELQAKLPSGISSFVAQGLNKSPLCSVIEQLKRSN